MYSTGPAPYDQRAGIRPIAFMLNNQGKFSPQVLLNVRPEDLTRNEPTRAAVHQTLGSGSAVGWVDNFGPGLPSCTINGHTGWRTATGTGMDGAAAFEALHKLVEVDYFNAKQSAVDSGRDPSGVQLIFIDTLDKFTWAVVPTQFTLRRSKSRPLLFQYQISLQAVDVNVGGVAASAPPVVNTQNALTSLDRSIGILLGGQQAGFSGSVLNSGMSRPAGTGNTGSGNVVAFPGAGNVVGLPGTQTYLPIGNQPSMGNFVADPISIITNPQSGLNSYLGVPAGVSTLSSFVFTAAGIFNTVRQAIALAKSTDGNLFTLGMMFSGAGSNLFHAIASLGILPPEMRIALMQIGGVFNEINCILRNIQSTIAMFQNYSFLFGSSNCSSTVGGSPPSIYAGQNVFALTAPSQNQFSLSSQANIGLNTLIGMDQILAPISTAEMMRNVGYVNSGVRLP